MNSEDNTKQQRFNITQKILFISASSLFALFAVYATLIVVWAAVDPPRQSAIPVKYFDDENQIFKHDPVWGPMNRPNHSYTRDLYVNGTRYRFSIHYDSIGVRVDNAGQVNLTSDPKMLVCGGSSMWGFGMENTDTMARVFGRRLGVHVANAATAGSGNPLVCLRIFERLLTQTKPTHLIMFVHAEDPKVHVRRCIPTPPPFCYQNTYARRTESGYTIIRPDNEPALRDWQKFKDWYQETSTSPDSTGTFQTDVYWTHLRLTDNLMKKISSYLPQPKEAEVRGAMAFIFSEFANLASKANAVPIIIWGNWSEWPQFKNIGKMAAKAGVHFYDANETKKRLEAEGRDFLFPRDGHISIEGHAALADDLKNWGDDQNLW